MLKGCQNPNGGVHGCSKLAVYHGELRDAVTGETKEEVHVCAYCVDGLDWDQPNYDLVWDDDHAPPRESDPRYD